MKLSPAKEFERAQALNPPILFCDLETFSSTPIQYGTHAYASAPDSEILLWAYAVDQGPIKVWDLTTGAPMPGDLEMMLLDPSVKTVWHNGAMFDRIVLKLAGQGKYRWIYDLIPPERVHDTMVQAYAHGLPGKLDQLCSIMQVPLDQAKDKEGKKWIQLFCKPLAANRKLRRATRETHPVEWQSFIDYAALDISAMRVLHGKLPTWNYRNDNQISELSLWYLDQRINERGIAVDTDLAANALAAITKEQKRLADEASELSAGELKSYNQRDALLKFLSDAYDFRLEDLKGSTLEKVLNDETLDEGVRELLRGRAQSSSTSTTKYKTLLRSNVNGVLYGLLQFCGAQRTGRWSGRVFQPQNLPRPDLDQALIELGILATKLGMSEQFAEVQHDVKKDPMSVMKLMANMIRSCFVARPGKKLVVSDLSNIEGRGAAYLAQEQWKLDAFETIDRAKETGEKTPDMYELTYARAFDIDPHTVDKFQRQIGKVMELALAYQGGVGAFVTFVHTYKLDLDALAEAAYPTLPPRVIKEAEDFLAWMRSKRMSTYGLSDKVYVVCEALKRLWREAHPEIQSYWKQLEEAAKAAIRNPGVTQPCRKVSFVKNGAWLRMILPSGRSICYPSAQIENDTIVYWGINQYNRQWRKIKTYGGKLFENACQAFARDIMAAAMPEAEMMGYEILLTVHDELITEAPDNDNYSDKGLSKILSTNRWWNEGMPLAAAGFSAPRYRKE